MVTRGARIGRRILDTAARLPIYVLLVAALTLVLTTANDAPHVTTAAAYARSSP